MKELESEKSGQSEKKEVKAPLYALYFDNSPESWEAVWALQRSGIYFALLKSTDEVEAPCLITPVGPYFGLEEIKDFIPMEESVREYLASREDHRLSE